MTQQFQALFEEAPVAYHEIDDSGAIRLVNRAECRLLGYQAHELIGRPVWELVAGEQRSASRAAVFAKLAGTQPPRPFLRELLCKDETRIRVEVHENLIRDDAQRITGIRSMLLDVTEKERMVEALAASEAHFRQFASAAQDATVVIDAHGNTTYWNPAAERLFGYSEAEALGRPVHELICPPELRAAHAQGFRRFLQTGQGAALGTTVELTGQKKGGECFPVELSLSAFRRKGEWNVIGGVRDVSARKHAEAELARYARELEAAGRAKSDFLASMSHEIRTPMNGIAGMTTLLLDTPLSAEQRSYAETVRSSADALLAVVNDILDFSKVEAGRMTLEKIPFDLRASCEDMIELVAPKARERGLELVLWYEPAAPAHVSGDPGRIRQIVLNLLSNAIKFTESGHVLLEVAAHGAGEGQAEFRLSVHDTGIGIPPEKIPSLFERFTQADTSTTRRYGGTGLGLAICRQLAGLMQGRIAAVSEAGGGATFSVWLPLEIDRTAPRVELPVADIQGLRVLVVDDNSDSRFATRELCAHWGMRSGETPDASAALDLLLAAQRGGDPYQLMITDWLMPGMDGEELSRTVRATPALAALPIILLSSIGQRDERARFAAAGCNGYLVKPVKAATLFEIVRRVAASGSESILTRHDVVPRHGAEIASVLPGFPGSCVLLVEDNPVNQKVGAKLLEKFACRVDVAANGVEAVQMVERSFYDLVLMDCRMPEMDGYEVTRRIRGLEGRAGRIPIVAMTASVLEEDRRRCAEAGMDGYVSKPVHLPALLAALEKWLPQPG
ncbi:MAG: PAS domain S-box protein [Acidobacteria bacterium]|nr:PAS domain S-box protein [Acidobacteriota bacterium]